MRAVKNAPEKKHSPAALYALAGITIGALILRLHMLATQSFSLDEGVSVGIARLLPWQDALRVMWRREGNMAMYYLLLRVWMHMGDSEAIIRGFSVLASVTAVPAIYFLGKRLFGPNVAIVAALLLALNAFAIRYSQDARSYSLLVLAVILSLYLFVDAVESPSLRRWTLYAFWSALCVYIHFFAVLITAAQLLSLCFFRPWRLVPGRLVLRSMGMFALFVSPIVLFILKSLHNQQLDWIPYPGLRSLYNCAQLLAGQNSVLLLIAYSGFALAALGVLLRAARKTRTSDDSFRLGLLTLCLLLPPALIVGASWLAKPLFVSRYMILILPALALLVARGIVLLPTKARMAAVLAVVVLSLQSVSGYYRSLTPSAGDDWRDAVRYVATHQILGDSVLFNNGVARPVFTYYMSRMNQGFMPSVVFPFHGERLTFRDFEGLPNPSSVSLRTQAVDRVWAVDWRTNREAASLLEKEFSRGDTKLFSGVTVTLYLRKYPAAGRANLN